MDTTGIDWQRQNFAKGGSPEPAPTQMNPKTWGGPVTSMNSKIAKPTFACGGMVKSGYADGGMVKGYAHGGEVEDKAAGLAASANDKVGFVERMRMGNIDEPGSEAYNRFGAGRAKADRDMASERDAMKAVDDARAKESASSDAKPSTSEPSAPARATSSPAKDTEFGDLDAAMSAARDRNKAEAPVRSASKTSVRAVKPAPASVTKPASPPTQSKAPDDGTELDRVKARYGRPTRQFDPLRDQSFGDYVKNNFGRVFGTQAMRDKYKK